MTNLTVINNLMTANNIDYLLVETTNEFLVEYNALEENSIYKLTNFSGSTGQLLITSDNKLFLFVDGRYHIQADEEVCHEIVTVEKLNSGETFVEKILDKIPRDKTLGMFSKKVSQSKYERYSKERSVNLLASDPLDSVIAKNTSNDIELNKELTGYTTNDKLDLIKKSLKSDEILYVTDLDEVSYLFNKRNYSIQPYSSKIKSRAIVTTDDAILYDESNLKTLEEFLKSTKKTVLVDKSSISAYDYKLINNVKELEKNLLKELKSRKTKEEIEHLKDAFNKTDIVVKNVRDYLLNNEVSEFDIANRLENEFKKQGAKSLSFKSIVAKDRNSALAHYSKASKEEIITDGSLVLIDCGAYFEGGLATDITRVFIKGKSTKLQIKIYTLVLKAFLRAYNYQLKENATGFDIDNMVREYFGSIDTEGFIFNHGLGHGIGINVHEYPPSLSKSELAKVKIEDGMCFSIEPGLYKENFFGVRLENSCYCEEGKIKSFVKMPYEYKLIDYNLLNEQEKIWLKEFEVI